MTNKIITAYLKNKEKFAKITAKSVALRDLENLRDDELHKVAKLYAIIFKGLSSRNEKVMLKGWGWLKGLKNEEYIVTPTGISVKEQYKINAESLVSKPSRKLIEELVYLAEPQNQEALRNALSKEKAKIFTAFMRKAKLLNIIDNIELISKIKTIQTVTNPREIHKLVLNGHYSLCARTPTNQIALNQLSGNRVVNFLEVNNLENTAYIEQLYPEIMELLKIALRTREKEVANLQKFVQYCKTKFVNQLVLEELSKNGN